MTREPLMLSDTAMVLLRHYRELCEHRWTMEEILSFGKPDLTEEQQAEWREWLHTHNHMEHIGQIERELIDEIWHLVTSLDQPVIRHLDWHLVFDDRLMGWVERTFMPDDTDECVDAVYFERHPIHVRRFIYVLFDVYYNALAEREKAHS
jgi:hypothetical protein